MRSSTPIFSSSVLALAERSPPNVASGSLPPSTRMTRTAGGVDAAEVLRQAAEGELADLPGQLDAGRSGADDDEGHAEPLQRGVAQVLGDLQRAVDTPPQLHGVVDRLHARRDQGELVVAEVRLPGAGGDNEAVVGVLADFAREGGGAARPAAPGRTRSPWRGRRRRSCAAAGCGAARARSSRARGSPWPPGRAAAGTGDGSAGRSA